MNIVVSVSVSVSAETEIYFGFGYLANLSQKVSPRAHLKGTFYISKLYLWGNFLRLFKQVEIYPKSQNFFFWKSYFFECLTNCTLFGFGIGFGRKKKFFSVSVSVSAEINNGCFGLFRFRPKWKKAFRSYTTLHYEFFFVLAHSAFFENRLMNSNKNCLTCNQDFNKWAVKLKQKRKPYLNFKLKDLPIWLNTN